MKRTTRKQFEYYLSGKARTLRKRIEEIKVEFLSMIKDANQNY